MVLLVVHPRSGRSPRREYGLALERAIAAVGFAVQRLETTPEPGGAARLAAALAGSTASTLVAAGGDGTVRDAVEALLSIEASRRPALVAVPVGTANNVAQSLAQFPRTRGGGPPPAGDVAALLAHGKRAGIDAARANGRVFAGSFAAGMDADLLAWRNRMASRVPAALAGYPLYLAACAVNSTRPHGSIVDVELHDEGRPPRVSRGHGFNVLVTNTAVYAGEFRFAAGCRHDDGVLDVLVSRDSGDYLRSYAAAWPRHLRARAGAEPTPDRRLQAASRVVLRFERPVQWQLDGEGMGAAARFEIVVERGAVDVLRRQISSNSVR